MVENLKIAELEANLASNTRAETFKLRRALEEFERKHEIAQVENEKLKMKLPKMDKMLQQKFQDFSEANGQSVAKILKLQQEGSAACISLGCKSVQLLSKQMLTYIYIR